MNKDIHFIITGGTIDSVFDPAKDAVVVNDHSVIAGYIDSVIQPHIKISSETLTLKDSRSITDNIKQEIAQSIQKATTSSIIVTHGTYTMPDTAKYLHDTLPEDHGKTVVLTGSMFPIKGFSENDAPYNLGFAIAAVQFLESGVYLAMNSHIFRAGDVIKNTEEGRFISA